MRVIAFLAVALACAGCGAGGSLELAPFVDDIDASCDPDGEAGATHGDATTNDGAMMPDAVFLDHGTNGADPDAALPRCMSNEDCDGWATCQSGLCCSGVLVGDTCTCGDGAGCDLRSACCVPFASTTMKNECVTNCESACGCTAAR